MAVLAINGGDKVRNTPFHRWPVWDDMDRKAINAVLESGNWGGYPSPNVWAKRLNEHFAAFQGAKHGIACTNGTVSLYIALRAAGVQAGDEVIVPPYTWIATCQAPAYINAVPVFADVDPQTYCLDPDAVEAAITPRTKAIIPVHLGCRFADMDRLMQIAEKHGLVVVEDCAHAHGGQWRGKGAGSLGHLGSFSFQSSKLMSAGEGGFITTNDQTLMEKCHSLINCGRKEEFYTNYEGELFGWNFRLGEFQCALLDTQLDKLEQQTLTRQANIRHFTERLERIPGIKTLKWDERITRLHSYMFIFKFVADEWDITRDQFSLALAAEGIENDPFFYVPVYQTPLFPLRASDYPAIRERYGDALDPAAISCPVSERAAYQESIWLHHRMFMGTKADVDDIADAIEKIRANQDELADKDLKRKSRF